MAIHQDIMPDENHGMSGRGDAHFSTYPHLSVELHNNYISKISTLKLLSTDEEQKLGKTLKDSREYIISLLMRASNVLEYVFDKIAEQYGEKRISFFFSLDELIAKELTISPEFLNFLKENSITSNAKTEKLLNGDRKFLFEHLNKMHPSKKFFDMCDEYLREISETSPEYNKLYTEYTEKLREMSEAMNTLVEHNLRLVISIAERYNIVSVSLADIIQEGNIGLMRATEFYDYTRGHRFSTYATFWIKQSITKFITNHSRIIRMPMHTISQLANIKAAEQKYFSTHGVMPDSDDLAKILNISAVRIRALQKMSQQTISIHGTTEEDDLKLEERIADPNSKITSHKTDMSELRSVLKEALDKLEDREKQIISMRYGLQDDNPKTLAELHEIFGISCERIRQIEKNAMSKMRVPDIMKQLDRYKDI